MKTIRRFLLPLAAAFLAFSAHAAPESEPGAEEIVKRSLDAFYYAGTGQRTRIVMKLVSPQGKVRDRELTMLRLNLGAAGDQRYYMYFHAPSDVKGTAFMVWKYAAKDDDRWIFVPAVKMVRRIAADDKHSSFVGSDFTYEDVSGREVGDESHAVLRKEDFAGRPVYVVESRPKGRAGYARRVSWIDRERWLPLREEYFDARNEPLRVFTADKVERIGNFWTAMARSMKNLQSGHRTEVTYQETEYGVGLGQDIFSERYLRDPPKQWVR